MSLCRMQFSPPCPPAGPAKRTRIFGTLPFVIAHLACFAALFTGVHSSDLIIAAALYALRMFGVTAGYHRYFAHRGFKTSRFFAFTLAFLAQSSAQRGILWWAGNHRQHHRFSDTDDDVHSPVRRGFWHAHLGWFFSDEHSRTDLTAIPDFAKFPELVWLDPAADVTNYLTRRLGAYHEEALARGVESAAGGAPSEGTEADSTVSIHEIEDGAILECLPPVDPEVRVLVRERGLGPYVTLDDYRDGTFAALWSSPDVAPPPPSAGEADAAGVSDALVWRFRATGPGGVGGITKSIAIADDRVEIEWHWAGDTFPPDAWFCPEFSLGCEVDLTVDPEPSESWTFPIVTVSKCPDGFEEIEQGRSVTPRWPAKLGHARVVIRPLAHHSVGRKCGQRGASIHSQSHHGIDPTWLGNNSMSTSLANTCN